MRKDGKKDILISQMRKRIENSNFMNIEQVGILHELIESLMREKFFPSASLEILLGTLELKEAKFLKENNVDLFILYLQKAKKHFCAALLVDNQEGQANYGLFEAALLEENYSEAYTQLDYYLAKGKGESNYILVYQLLEELMGHSQRKRNGNENYIFDVKVDYEPMLCNYSLALEALQRKDYQKAIKHISICKSLNDKKGLGIDFSSVLELLNKIFLWHQNSQKKAFKDTFARTSNVGERVLIAQKLLELDSEDIESNFLYMDAYIDLKAYNPLLECIKRVKDLKISKEQEEMLELYERIIQEITIESLHLKDIYRILDKGQRLRTEGLYSEEIDTYLNALQTIQFPYFYVKLAEAYYEMGNLEKSLEYGNYYLKTGYLYYVPISILFYTIYKKQGDSEKALMQALNCYQKARMKERGISLNDWINRLNGYSQQSGSFKVLPKKYIYTSKN